MSFPNAIQGSPGLQFQTYTSETYPLGAIMELPDGRVFRFALAGAANLAAGVVCQAAAHAANSTNLAIPTARATGVSQITITNGATAVVANQFRHGLLNVEDATTGGQAYRIASNTADAGSGTITLNFAPNETLQTALTTSSKVGLQQSAFYKTVVHPSPATAKLVGVTVGAGLAAGAYGWLQVHGGCSVLTQGTVVINEKVADSATVDGAVAAIVLTEGAPNTDAGQFEVGIVERVLGNGLFSLVFLTLE